MTRPPATKSPSVRRRADGALVLEREPGDHRLDRALSAVLRLAIASSENEAACAALCKVSVEELREVSRLTGVPLLFVVAAPRSDAEGGGA